ncbi:MAG: hypothetical protein ACKVWR_06980 [Acidimicrobiales bacterium]
MGVGGSLEPGTAFAFLHVEHGWGQPLFYAITDCGGALVGEGFLTPEVGLLVEAGVAVMEEATRVIAAAQADEAQMMLLALAAPAQAVKANSDPEANPRGRRHPGRWSPQASWRSSRPEAVEAQTAAGVVAAAANQIATKTVSEAAVTVKAASITMAQARVLRYLLTQSSFAVIADRLWISRAATEERAERVCKKLRLHSRTDAVVRARALGIIE